MTLTLTALPRAFPALRCCLLVVVATLLTACAQTPVSAERYLLPQAAATAGRPMEAEDTTALALRELRLAAFLDGEGLVLQLDDISLNEARNHRWAEALPLQLRRKLRQELQQRLSSLVVLDSGAARVAALQLSIEVDAFHGLPNGHARVAGRWLLQDATGKLLADAEFQVDKALADDGYPALVRALGAGWDEVSAGIAVAVQAARPGPAS